MENTTHRSFLTVQMIPFRWYHLGLPIMHMKNPIQSCFLLKSVRKWRCHLQIASLPILVGKTHIPPPTKVFHTITPQCLVGYNPWVIECNHKCLFTLLFTLLSWIVFLCLFASPPNTTKFEKNREFTNHVVATINKPTFGPKHDDLGMQIYIQQPSPFLFGICEIFNSLKKIVFIYLFLKIRWNNFLPICIFDELRRSFSCK